MKKVLRRRPSAAMIVAIIALAVALSGTAVAAGKLGLSALANGAKNKTVGVGKLTYVTAAATANSNDADAKVVTAPCPSGTHVIGGGAKVEDPNFDFVEDSYPSSTGWTARVFAASPTPNTTHTFIITAICAASRAVTGAPAG